MIDRDDINTFYGSVARPWIVLNTTFDVEAWIDNFNRELMLSVKKKSDSGYGICFCLEQGGDIFMHTTDYGDILLDVTPEAEWVSPAITAATQISRPHGQIWMIPGESLTKLVLGLSSLIGSTRIVHQHTFKLK